MARVNSVTGVSEESRRRYIKDMEPGETGYTVEWAYDEKTGQLDDGFPISSKGGTASMRVTCVKRGVYDIAFETPEYKPIEVK